MGIFDTNVFQGGSTEAVDTVTIVRYAASGADRNSRTSTVVYAGPADFQQGTGDTYTDPGGAVQTAAAICLIDPAADGSLPAVKSVGTNGQGGDVLKFERSDGTIDEYVIVLVDMNAFPPAHLELTLKKSTGVYRGPS